MQWTSKESNITTNRFATGKTRNSLIYYRLINRRSNIFTARTFINKRLNISFSKNTTTSGNRINCRSPPCKLIKTVSISFQKSSHLVNKSTCSTSTGTVHTLFNTIIKISDFSVFSTQFNYNISLWNKFAHSRCRSNNLLNKWNTQPLRNRKSTRTCNFCTYRLIFAKFNQRSNCVQSR